MDHLHQIPRVGPPDNWMLEGNTILAGLAARTSRSTSACSSAASPTATRRCWPSRRRRSTSSRGGRAIFGLGAAWFEGEHHAYGFGFPPLKERFERLEDALHIARADVHRAGGRREGKHYRTDDAINNPRPLRGDIPILIGGSGERKTLRFVAKYADGCNLFGDVERVKHLLGVLEGHCEDVGRDPRRDHQDPNGAGLHRAPTHEEAAAKVEPVVARAAGPARGRGRGVRRRPGEVGRAGPVVPRRRVGRADALDPTSTTSSRSALAGEALGAVIGTRRT